MVGDAPRPASLPTSVSRSGGPSATRSRSTSRAKFHTRSCG